MDEDPYTIKYIMKGAPSSNASSSSPYGTLIQEAKFIFHSYSWISFSHTKYKGNKETHNHARFAKRCFRFIVWMAHTSPQFQAVIQMI